MWCQPPSLMTMFVSPVSSPRQVDESNLLVWQGLLVPDTAPYNKVARRGQEMLSMEKKSFKVFV